MADFHKKYPQKPHPRPLTQQLFIPLDNSLKRFLHPISESLTELVDDLLPTGSQLRSLYFRSCWGQCILGWGWCYESYALFPFSLSVFHFPSILPSILAYSCFLHSCLPCELIIFIFCFILHLGLCMVPNKGPSHNILLLTQCLCMRTCQQICTPSFTWNHLLDSSLKLRFILIAYSFVREKNYCRVY